MEREVFIVTTFTAQGSLPCKQLVRDLGGTNFQTNENTTSFEYVVVGNFNDEFVKGDTVYSLDYDTERALCLEQLQPIAENRAEDIHNTLFEAGFDFDYDFDNE